MNLKASPVCQYGERNIYCPFYDDCLDHAVERQWDNWSCSLCPNRSLKHPLTEIRQANNEEVAYYELMLEPFETFNQEV